MVKVIHVVSDTNIGGAGRWVLNFLKEVDKQTFTVVTVVPQGSLLKKEIEKTGGRVVEVPGMADRSFDIKSIKYLYALFKRENPNIVHTHASLSARIAAKLAGIKAIAYTKHCIDQHIRTGVKAKINAFANVCLSSNIIAVADAAKQNLIDSGIPEKMIMVLHNGVERLEELPGQVIEQTKKEWDIQSNEIVIGIIARLEEIKGHCYFLEAARKVADQLNNVKFLVVGTGSKEEGLKQQVQALGLKQQVIFTGHLEDVTPMMNMLDINVISSLSEALCLSIIEGMSIGKPCIATCTGGNPELVRDGENGILVPVKDVQALADAMIKLAGDEQLRRRMGISGKQLMEQHFTAHAMTKKLEKMYKMMVDKKK